MYISIAALQTARAGSKSVPNKNLMMYKGMPLFKHNLMHVINSTHVHNLYVSTDSKEIMKECKSTRNTLSRSLGFNPTNAIHVIKRPAKLCKDESSHYDTILHGLKYIERKQKSKVDLLVVLLGNTPHAYTEDLDAALECFTNNWHDFDSCQSVGKFNMFNPQRAFNLRRDGTLVPVVGACREHFLKRKKNINDKDAFGDIYFFNGSFWIIKRETLLKNEGRGVFSWLGNRVMPWEQNSTYQEIDAEWQTKLL
jgi:CMP-N-acetylneuraminic acid synthetase